MERVLLENHVAHVRNQHFVITVAMRAQESRKKRKRRVCAVGLAMMRTA